MPSTLPGLLTSACAEDIDLPDTTQGSKSGFVKVDDLGLGSSRTENTSHSEAPTPKSSVPADFMEQLRLRILSHVRSQVAEAF